MQSSAGRLAELIGALAYATGLAAGLPAETAVRTCVTAVGIGRELGLDPPRLSDLYYAGLLRFVGCTAFAHETAVRYGAADDLRLLAALTVADPAKPVAVLGAAWRGAGPSVAGRVRTVAALATDPRAGQRFAAAHCGLAVALARTMGMSEPVLAALGQIYERYDGRGHPAGLRGSEISLPARILHVAWETEAHRALVGPAAAGQMLARRRGAEFDPAVCDAAAGFLDSVLDSEESPGWEEFLAAEPEPRRLLGPDQTVAVATGFARFADLKSPYTIGHSTGVAELVRAAGERCGLPAAELHRLYVAGLLHDLGRVSVPNGIWDAPRPLRWAERERVRLGAYHTDRILAQSPLLRPYLPLAGSAYERLDGSGYPKGLPGASLDPPARLLAAADVYHAMTEDRPHRPALAADRAVAELAEEVRAGRLDAGAVEAVLAAAGRAQALPRHYPDGLTAREVAVLVLLARGLTNKSIARRLGISPRTVQNHIAHVFGKTGVSGRAGAAVYAVSHGLDAAAGAAPAPA